LAKTLSDAVGLAYIDLRRFDVHPDTVRSLSKMQARRFRALVLEDRKDTYLVGMVDPSDLRSQDEIASILRRPVEVALITNDQLMLTMDRIYRKTALISEFAKEVERDVE
jgi:MSHA biogenesis protein MshE